MSQSLPSAMLHRSKGAASHTGGLSMIDATPRLMLHQYWYCNTEKRCVIGFIPAQSIASVRLIRGSGTRYVAVDVPLAKLGLTTCPETRGASEASDRDDRDSR